MADIYSKSHLTIAATRSSSSHHGFLFDFPADVRHYNVVVDKPWDPESESETFQMSFSVNHKNSEMNSTPLNGRAWCLQEWYLPIRMVEFRLHDLRFLCDEKGYSRFGITKEKSHWCKVLLRGSTPNGKDKFYQLWEFVRSNYFNRSLSRKSDLLPAMAGLAQQFQNLDTDNVYLAGVWSKTISEGFCWNAIDFNPETVANKGVPSWTWASVTQDATHMYHEPIETFVEYVDSNCTGFARLIEATPSLRIVCFIAPMFMRVDMSLSKEGGQPHITLWIDEDLAIGASSEDVRAIENFEVRIRNHVVLDMGIGPTSHDEHTGTEMASERACQVPSIQRTPTSQEICSLCANKGYVGPIQLILVARTDIVYTALVVAPVPSNELIGDEFLGDLENPVYRRLGLLEIDGIKGIPVMHSADGNISTLEDFWDLGNSSAAKVVVLV
jgi:hypothetical protein